MKDGFYSEKSSYVYEISSDYKLNEKAIYNPTIFCQLIFHDYSNVK